MSAPTPVFRSAGTPPPVLDAWVVLCTVPLAIAPAHMAPRQVVNNISGLMR